MPLEAAEHHYREDHTHPKMIGQKTCPRPDDGVGCPLFRGGIKPDRTFKCRSRQQVALTYGGHLTEPEEVADGAPR